MLEAVAERFLAGEDMTLLTNRRRELCGFIDHDLVETRVIPVAMRYVPRLAERRRSFAMSDWRLGEDALIQATSVDGRGETICVDDVSGTEAWHRLMQLACDPKARPVGDPNAVYGLAWPDGSREEMWDCDECTYAEYLSSLAKAVQDSTSDDEGGD